MTGQATPVGHGQTGSRLELNIWVRRFGSQEVKSGDMSPFRRPSGASLSHLCKDPIKDGCKGPEN